MAKYSYNIDGPNGPLVVNSDEQLTRTKLQAAYDLHTTQSQIASEKVSDNEDIGTEGIPVGLPGATLFNMPRIRRGSTAGTLAQFAPTAIRVGGALTGAALATPETLGLGAPAGGAAGAAVAEPAAQSLEMLLGQRENPSIGEGALNVGLAALPVGRVARAVPLNIGEATPAIEALVKRAAANAVEGGVVGGAQGAAAPVIREGRAPTLAEVGEGAAFGGITGGALSGLLDSGNLAAGGRLGSIASDQAAAKKPGVAETASNTKAGSNPAAAADAVEATGTAPAAEAAAASVNPLDYKNLQQLDDEGLKNLRVAVSQLGSDIPAEVESAQALIAKELGGSTPNLEAIDMEIARRSQTSASGLKVRDDMPQEKIDAIKTAVADPDTKWQFTVQRGADGKTGGFVQVDAIQNGENTVSSSIADLRAAGANVPDVPDYIPQGQYTREQLDQLIANNGQQVGQISPEAPLFKQGDQAVFPYKSGRITSQKTGDIVGISDDGLTATVRTLSKRGSPYEIQVDVKDLARPEGVTATGEAAPVKPDLMPGQIVTFTQGNGPVKTLIKGEITSSVKKDGDTFYRVKAAKGKSYEVSAGAVEDTGTSAATAEDRARLAGKAATTRATNAMREKAVSDAAADYAQKRVQADLDANPKAFAGKNLTTTLRNLSKRYNREYMTNWKGGTLGEIGAEPPVFIETTTQATQTSKGIPRSGTLNSLATPVLGGVVGGQIGDTEEERRANAARGALAGLAVGAGGLLASNRFLKGSGAKISELGEKGSISIPGAVKKNESEPIFYSQLTKAVKSLPQEKLTIEQALAAINKGAKPDEIENSGLAKYLQSLPPGTKITKSELIDQAIDAEAKIGDVVLTETPTADFSDNEVKFSKYVTPGGTDYKEQFVSWPSDKLPEPPKEAAVNRISAWNKLQETMQEQRRIEEALFKKYTGKDASLRGWHIEDGLDDWQNDGRFDALIEANATQAERDHLNGLTTKMYDRERAYEAARGLEQRGWKDGHREYKQSVDNPIVRLRRNIRTDADGNKVLFLEEIQGPTKDQQVYMPEYLKKRIYEIGMKRALRDAIDNGSDKLAWTSGDMQVERYNQAITDKVSGLRYNKETGILETQAKHNTAADMSITSHPEGYEVIDSETGGHMGFFDTQEEAANFMAKQPSRKAWTTFGTFKPQDLEQVLGKDLADKIISSGDAVPTITGDNLSIGGKGLRQLYDRDLVSIGNKLAKKFGGKVTTTEIPVDTGNVTKRGVESLLEYHNMVNRDWSALPAQTKAELINEFERDVGIKVPREQATERVHSIDLSTPEAKARAADAQPLYSFAHPLVGAGAGALLTGPQQEGESDADYQRRLAKNITLGGAAGLAAGIGQSLLTKRPPASPEATPAGTKKPAAPASERLPENPQVDIPVPPKGQQVRKTFPSIQPGLTRLQQEATIASGMQNYTPIPNEATQAQVRQVLNTDGLTKSISRVQDSNSGLTNLQRTALGGEVLLALQKKAQAAEALGASRATQSMNDFLNFEQDFFKSNTDLGQAVSYLRQVKQNMQGPRYDQMKFQKAVDDINTKLREAGHEPIPKGSSDAFKQEIAKEWAKIEGLEGKYKQFAQVDLDNKIAGEIYRLSPLKDKASEVLWSYFYGNMLSGWKTQIANFMGSAVNSSLKGTFLALDNPAAAQSIMEDARAVTNNALNEAALITKTGKVMRAESIGAKTAGSTYFERQSDLNPYKYIPRAMAASDQIFYAANYELFTRSIAEKLAGLKGLKGEEAAKFVSDLTGIKGKLQDEMDLAMNQARAELDKAQGAGKIGFKGSNNDRGRENLIRARAYELVDARRPEAIRQQAHNYALRATYNQEPEGFLGAISRALSQLSAKYPLITKPIVPFNRIVANVLNQQIEYTPYSLVRFYKQSPELIGKKLSDVGIPTRVLPKGLRMKADEFQRTMNKALADNDIETLSRLAATEMRGNERLLEGATGTALATALAAGAGFMTLGTLMEKNIREGKTTGFDVTGDGPSDYTQKQQLQQTGWKPYSVRVGDKYFSYANTPLNLGLSIIGGYADALRYRKLEDRDAAARLAYSVTQLGPAVLNASFLKGLADFVQGLTDKSIPKQDPFPRYAGKAASFVVPRLLPQVSQIFDPNIYTANDVKSALLKDVPFANAAVGRPVLNSLGEPINQGTTVADRALDRFYGQTKEKANPLYKLMASKDRFMATPTAGDVEFIAQDGTTVPATRDLYYDFVKRRGEIIRSITDPMERDLAALDPDSFQQVINRIATKAGAAAKAEISGSIQTGSGKPRRRR